MFIVTEYAALTETARFICKHKETLVKTIPCNLTKACRIFSTFTESLYKSMGILP